MRVTHVGFLATEKGGAKLHGISAEHKRRRRGAAVGYAAGGDDRNPHRVDDLRQEREQYRLRADVDGGEVARWPPASVPCAMIASTPRSSSSRASATIVALDRMKIPADFRTRMTSGSGRPK